ncbi:MAG: UvrD-helicase domain-containing protein [Sphaerochaetaceae bacterium]|nr:UvrD-helicase domain-containing protein [Sphaerochaetaceae bacterium]
MKYEIPSRFTPPQRNAVLTDESCVVSAGAGSGKTAVLSERFIRLVTEGKAHCNEILAMTFTRKAAAEMKSRIYSLLLKRGLKDELPLFREASISTVDSLLSEIARTGCIRFGISPGFSVLDTDDYFETEKSLARKLLERLTPSVLTMNLLPATGVDSICKLYASIAQSCFSITEEFDSDKHEEACLRALKSTITSQEAQLLDVIDSYITNLGTDSKLTGNISVLNSFRNSFSSLDKEDRIGKANCLRDLAFTSARGEKMNQEYAKELKAEITGLKNSIIYAEEALGNREFIHQFYLSVSEYYKIVIESKRSMNAVSFNDVMQMSLSILTDSRRIRDSYKDRYKYIMVDEFQDNNDNYRKLIYLLSERKDLFSEGIPEPEDLTKGKIFLVGDEKQSIYRFRGADVSVFKRMQDEIRRAGGSMMELETNFRTEPELLDSFNSIFSRVMDSSSRVFDARFRHLENRGVQYVKPHLMVHTVEKEEDEEAEDLATADQSEAWYISSIINEMTGNPQYLVSYEDPLTGEMKSREAVYDDFAILFRSAGAQSDYEKALRLNGIPYTVEESRSQTREALVNDFYSILQIAVYNKDQVSLASFVNGPLSDGKSTVKELSENDRRTIDELMYVLSSRGLSSAVDWIWNCAGYRSFIISNPANQVYDEHYLWLYSLSVSFEQAQKTAVDFLDYLRPYIEGAESSSEKGRDVKVLRTQSGGVSLMTIHKSKGLEFPIVIVAGMDRLSSSNNKNLSFSIEEECLYLPVVFTDKKLPVDSVRYFGLGTVKLEEEAELKRLFYVAATRAKNHLVFSRSFKRDSEDSMWHLLESVFSDDEAVKELKDILEIKSEIQVDQKLLYSYSRLRKEEIERCSSWYEDSQALNVDYSEKSIGVTSMIQRPEGLQREPLKSLESDRIIREHGLQTDFGTYTHALIESFIKKTEAPEFKTEVEITESELQTLKKDALSLATGFINSPLYREIINSDYEIESEKRFIYYDGEMKTMVEGVIDLLIYNGNRAVVYDFKTDSFRNPLEHKAQLDVYARAVKSIWKEKVVETDVLYLREFL